MLRGIACRLLCNISNYHRLGVISIASPIVTQLAYPVRFKFINYGVQGRRNTKLVSKKRNDDNIDEEIEFLSESGDELKLDNDSDYERIANDAMHVTRGIRNEQNVLIIQPYIKWGPKRSDVPADVKLLEAEDLIRSLDTWKIQQSIKVGLISFNKATIFGSGKLEELQLLVKKSMANPDTKITCVFISKSMLSQNQKKYLEDLFQVPVMDRFSVVIQILRIHATSRESRLQVALAEIPYIWRQLGREGPQIRCYLTDSQKLTLKNREKKIKEELDKVRQHRQLIRKRRFQKKFPIIAVVGYTNAGKTSLIKALTNEEKMQPRNQLFATLEITAHMGVLPCNLQVIFMDTVGFMSDIPTDLIECFIATMEDAMLADLIIHVQDLSHINADDQRKHVEVTLKRLMARTENQNTHLLNNVINVGNKMDLVEDINAIRSKYQIEMDENEDTADVLTSTPPIHFISSTKLHGIADLMKSIEKNILRTTNRIKMIIRVPQSGEELAWLYKNAAVTRCEADTKNSEYLLAHVVITELTLLQFKNTFLNVNKNKK